MNPYRIVLADDHKMLRQGIKKILAEVDDLEIVGEASDGLELLELLKRLKPELVILDISMPNLRGIEATREIKLICPDIRVLILTMYNDREYLYHAISAGADGYLLKEDADTELFSAIAAIRRGRTYLSPLLAGDVTEDLVQIARGERGLRFESLTTREKEVLKLVAEGKSNKQIAELLCISVRTVEHHRANMMNKLALKRTADLVKYAIRKGYTSATS